MKPFKTKHATIEERSKEFKFYCDKCDFGTFAEILFTRHLETKKHNNTPLETILPLALQNFF